jgi:hypothetical protein
VDKIFEHHGLYRVAVVPLWLNYRVNVLVGTVPTAVRTTHSYFVAADEAGRIHTATAHADLPVNTGARRAPSVRGDTSSLLVPSITVRKSAGVEAPNAVVSAPAPST